MTATRYVTFDDIVTAMGGDQCEADIPGVGTVLFRLLTMEESDRVRELSIVDGELDQKKFQEALLVTAMVAPALSAEQVDKLRERATVYYGLVNAIIEANGMGVSAQKAFRRSFRDGQSSQNAVCPSA